MANQTQTFSQLIDITKYFLKQLLLHVADLIDLHMIVRRVSLVNSFDLVPEPKLHEIIIGLNDLLMHLWFEHICVQKPVDPLQGVGYFKPIENGIDPGESNNLGNHVFDIESVNMGTVGFDRELPEKIERYFEEQGILSHLVKKGLLILGPAADMCMQVRDKSTVAIETAEIEEYGDFHEVFRC